MAAGSKMGYLQLRKLDFPIVRYPGGVSTALRQHREAVAHLLGPDGMISSTHLPSLSKLYVTLVGPIADEDVEIEPANWYAGGWLDLPASPGLASIFDFGDPAAPPSPSSTVPSTADDDSSASLPSPPSPTTNDESQESEQRSADDSVAVQNGTDEASIQLARDLSSGLRRSGRGAPSQRPVEKKRKRESCADDSGPSSPSSGDDDDLLPPPPKKKRTISAPPPPPPPPAAASSPSSASSATTRGDLVGTALPAAVQTEADFISALPRLANGLPSRNRLRKAPETAGEVSRKTGHLKSVKRGGMLRRWFGDEAVFGAELWGWLVGEHGG